MSEEAPKAEGASLRCALSTLGSYGISDKSRDASYSSIDNASCRDVREVLAFGASAAMRERIRLLARDASMLASRDTPGSTHDG